jgi:uncharacterized membrane protein HdeD (DUF308 family)
MRAAASGVIAQTSTHVSRALNGARSTFIAAAGAGIIVLGGIAALSPALNHASATTVLGLLLATAGLLEIIAGKLRRETRFLAMLAGLATIVAGAMLISNRSSGILPNVTVITGWLVTRSVILVLTWRLAHGSMRKFLGIAAATDFMLGAALFVGVSVATLAVTIFGPSPQLLASYGFVLALSFVATGGLLLEAAGCERTHAVKIMTRKF